MASVENTTCVHPADFSLDMKNGADLAALSTTFTFLVVFLSTMLYWCGPLCFYPCCCSPFYCFCQRCTAINERRGKPVLFLLSTQWERIMGRVYVLFMILFEVVLIYSEYLREAGASVKNPPLAIVSLWITSNILSVCALVTAFFSVGKFRFMIHLPPCFHLMVATLALIDTILDGKITASTPIQIVFILAALWITFHIPSAFFFTQGRIQCFSDLSDTRNAVDFRSAFELVGSKRKQRGVIDDPEQPTFVVDNSDYEEDEDNAAVSEQHDERKSLVNKEE